jgi:hypothetical protein
MFSIRCYLAKKYKTLILIVTLVVYYEIKLYENSFCEKNISVTNDTKFFGSDEFVFKLSDKINKFLRFGDEYQNFILSLIYHKTKNNKLLLDGQDIDIIEDMNK